MGEMAKSKSEGFFYLTSSKPSKLKKIKCWGGGDGGRGTFLFSNIKMNSFPPIICHAHNIRVCKML